MVTSIFVWKVETHMESVFNPEALQVWAVSRYQQERSVEQVSCAASEMFKLRCLATLAFDIFSVRRKIVWNLPLQQSS